MPEPTYWSCTCLVDILGRIYGSHQTFLFIVLYDLHCGLRVRSNSVKLCRTSGSIPTSGMCNGVQPSIFYCLASMQKLLVAHQHIYYLHRDTVATSEFFWQKETIISSKYPIVQRGWLSSKPTVAGDAMIMIWLWITVSTCHCSKIRIRVFCPPNSNCMGLPDSYLGTSANLTTLLELTLPVHSSSESRFTKRRTGKLI